MKSLTTETALDILIAWLQDEPPRESWRLNFLRKR